MTDTLRSTDTPDTLHFAVGAEGRLPRADGAVVLMVDSTAVGTPDGADRLLMPLSSALPAGAADYMGQFDRGVANFGVADPFGINEMPHFSIDPMRGYRTMRNTLYQSCDLVVAPVRYGYLNADDVGLGGAARLADGVVVQSNIYMSTGRYPHQSRWYGGSVNASISYQPFDRLVLSAYGQYSTMPFTSSALSTSMYGTNYGASAEYRVADWVSVVGGAERTFLYGKWQTNLYAYPVLHIGNVSIPIPAFNWSPNSNDRYTAPHGGAVPTPQPAAKRPPRGFPGR